MKNMAKTSIDSMCILLSGLPFEEVMLGYMDAALQSDLEDLDLENADLDEDEFLS